jgi:Arc/MetJ-type ribon-helix-helix transcriptional regulator
MLTQSGDYRDRSKVVRQGIKGLDGRPRKGVDDMCPQNSSITEIDRRCILDSRMMNEEWAERCYCCYCCCC